MRHDKEKATQWLRERAPDAFEIGSPKYALVQGATQVAVMRGYGLGSDEHLSIVDENLTALENDMAAANGDPAQVRLKKEELEVAKFSGISPERYAAAKAELKAYGLLNRHPKGY